MNWQEVVMIVTRSLARVPLRTLLKKYIPVTIIGAKRGNAELAAKREAQNPKILITG